jgi:hypothetical protein
VPTKLLKLLGLIAFVVAAASWVAIFDIETIALWNSDHSSGEFTERIHLKGVVRYVTPGQKRWDDIAQAGFIGGWLLGGVVIIASKWS